MRVNESYFGKKWSLLGQDVEICYEIKGRLFLATWPE
jgi:hypothetical protein